MDLNDIIRRLEEASEGSRELSDVVLMAVGWRHSLGPNVLWFAPDGKPWKKARPCPTTSLDEALTLVPEGHVGRIGFGGPGFVFAFAATPRDWGAGRVSTVRAASPAISLCIAALKARALSKEG